MPDQNLVDYVRRCRDSGMSDAQIREQLLVAKWNAGDIDAVLAPITPVASPSIGNSPLSKTPSTIPEIVPGQTSYEAPAQNSGGPSKMPGLVRAVAIIGLIGSGLSLLFGILATAGGFLFSTLGKSLSSGVPFMGTLGQAGGTMFFIMGIFLILLSPLFFIASRGLWKGKNWARMFFACFGAIQVISFIIALVTTHKLNGIVSAFFAIAIATYLLFSSKVKSAFSDTESRVGQNKSLAISIGCLVVLFIGQQAGAYFMGKSVGANLQDQLAALQASSTANTVSEISPLSQKDCGADFNCLIDAAKTCTPAKVDVTTTVDLSKMFVFGGTSQNPSTSETIQTSRSISEIKGITNGKCVYFTKLIDVQNPNIPPEAIAESIKEGEMTCSYDSADLAIRLKNVQDGNTSVSFDSGDTPAQKAEKACKNYGASLDGSTSFSTSTKVTPELKYSMSYTLTVNQLTLDAPANQKARVFGNKNEISFQVGKIEGNYSAEIGIFDKSGTLVKLVTLKLGESVDVLNNTVELKSINTPRQIVLKISEFLK